MDTCIILQRRNQGRFDIMPTPKWGVWVNHTPELRRFLFRTSAGRKSGMSFARVRFMSGLYNGRGHHGSSTRKNAEVGLMEWK